MTNISPEAKAIDKHIEDYLVANERSQNWLAGKIGLTATSVTNKRLGVCEWKLSEIVKLSKLLDVRVSKLIS